MTGCTECLIIYDEVHWLITGTPDQYPPSLNAITGAFDQKKHFGRNWSDSRTGLASLSPKGQRGKLAGPDSGTHVQEDI
jgi:hypothetical protein